MLRSGALSIAFALAIAIGCGSASEESLFGPPHAGTWKGGSSSTGGAQGSGGGTASGGTETGGAPEAGGAAAGGSSSAGGAAATGGTGGNPSATGGSGGELGSPGVISCSGIPCRSDMMPANTCCIARSGIFQTSCRPEFPPCSAQLAWPFYCDDAADCGGGAVCCAHMEDGVTTAKCATECDGGEGSVVQLCRTNAECSEGRHCDAWDKLPEYSICQ